MTHVAHHTPSITTFALWDKIGNEFLSWKHPTYKSTREHLYGYFNHQAIAILKVVGTKVMYEVQKNYLKEYKASEVDIALAQKKYAPPT